MTQLALNSFFEYEAAVQIVHTVAFFHNFAIWLFHWTYSCHNPRQINKIHRISVWALSIISIASFCFWATPFFAVYNDVYWNIPLNQALCNWIRLPARLSYIWSRTIGLYYVYITRLFDIFSGNIYAFHKWQMRSLLSSLAVITVFVTIAVPYQTLGASEYNAERNRCNIGRAAQRQPTMIIVDVVFVNFIIALYCRRLLFFEQKLKLKLLENRVNPPAPNPHLAADEMYLKVMVRTTVLTFVAMISTQASLIWLWLMGNGLIVAAIDLMINTWCLVLIFEVYDHFCNCFHRCCCICEKLMCYHCIVFYSCYWCCKVNMGVSNDFSLDIKAPADPAALDPTPDDNAPRGDDRNMTGDTGGSVELQMAETRQNLSPNNIETIRDGNSIGI